MSPQLFIKRLSSMLIMLCIGSIGASAQTWTLDTTLSTGANSSGIAITSDGSKLVVTNNTSPGKVKIISTSTFKMDSVDVSSIENNPNGVSIAPNDSVAIVNTLHNTIYINIKRNTIMGHYAAPCVGTSLYGISVTPDGSTAVYPDLSSGCTQQGVRVITATSVASSSSFILVATTGELYGIGVSPNSNLAFVTTFTSDVPKIVNLTTSAVQNISGAISGSYGVAMFHNSAQALYFDGDSLDIVSLNTGAITAKITPLDYNTNFQNIAISSDDKYAFVTGAFEKFAISLTTNSVIQTFGSGQTNIATNSNGSWFYVTDSYNGQTRFYKESGTGVQEYKNNTMNISVYPNPNMGQFTVQSSSVVNDPSSVEVYNILGEKVYSNSLAFHNSHLTVDLSNQPNGVYLYRVVEKSGGLISEGKVIIQK